MGDGMVGRMFLHNMVLEEYVHWNKKLVRQSKLSPTAG